MGDRTDGATTYPIPPAVWARMEAAGFELGSGNPITWLIGEVERLRGRQWMARWTVDDIARELGVGGDDVEG